MKKVPIRKLKIFCTDANNYQDFTHQKITVPPSYKAFKEVIFNNPK